MLWSIRDGFWLGAGLSLGFLVVRLPFALVILAVETYLAKLRERQVVLHHRIANLRRAAAALDRMIGKEPEK